jgi:hypothetical protein
MRLQAQPPCRKGVKLVTNTDETAWLDFKDAIGTSQPPQKDPADELKMLEEDLYVYADILKRHVHRFIQELGQSDHPLKERKIRELNRLLASFT